jgi:hypothetical protein
MQVLRKSRDNLKLADIPDYIQTRNLLNTSLKRYSLNQHVR